MQVCNNCGTVSDAHARTCPHCRMQGNFTQTSDPAAPDSSPTETRQCQNCGNSVGIHLPKCPDCRFPFKTATISREMNADGTFVIGSLRAG